MNSKLTALLAVSLLALLLATGCVNYNDQPEGSPFLINTGDEDTQNHSLTERQYGVTNYERAGLSASAYVSGNTIIFYAGGCDTFTATILSNSELAPFVVNPMNTIDNEKCQQDNEGTLKLKQHLQNVTDNLGTFRVLRNGGFTLDGVPFGLALYDWVTPPLLPGNFYADEEEPQIMSLPTTREEAMRHPDYVIDPGGGVTPKACWNETPGGGGSFNGDECDLPWWPATMGAPLPDNFDKLQLDPQISGSSARSEFEMRIMNALGDNLPKGVRFDPENNLVIITIFTEGEDVPMSRINKYRQLGQQAAGGIMVDVEVRSDGIPRTEVS
jgi:hypothetical protein